ncbi:large conductance mechanosensitive channel protein MscL [Synechococcus sp. UW140]|uniref:large conductance mechanosensitive channel protein MscL n=1 Tax=Synechococcus sp. UW140 TaxID=368503 RepID=UPI0025FBF663|nr:large conductance mechanosensitive channel protein MscL [Synechococcus sp. UW140]
MVKQFLRDFRNFLQQGNVIELAIAVVIGGAFGKVVDALVSLVMGQLLTPTLKSLGIGQINQWPAGNFLVALINFVVISLVVFSVMRTIQNLKRQEEISTTAAAATDPQLLLAEAADRLAKALESRQL